MTRIQKNKDAKKNRKTIIYPIISFVVITILLMIVIDYRINNVFGTGGIRIVGAQVQSDKITLNVFDEKAASIDFEFAKRDMIRLREGVFEYVSRFGDVTRSVIKLY